MLKRLKKQPLPLQVGFTCLADLGFKQMKVPGATKSAIIISVYKFLPVRLDKGPVINVVKVVWAESTVLDQK